MDNEQGDGSFGPVKMYDITCSECGNPGKVKFPPTPGRRVLCNDCFRKQKRRF